MRKVNGFMVTDITAVRDRGHSTPAKVLYTPYERGGVPFHGPETTCASHRAEYG